MVGGGRALARRVVAWAPPRPLTPPRPPLPLQVEGAQDVVDVLIGDQFQFEPTEQRVTFPAGEDVWALRLGTAAAFAHFLARYNRALFENRFGIEQTEANQAKARGGVNWAGGG